MDFGIKFDADRAYRRLRWGTPEEWGLRAQLVTAIVAEATAHLGTIANALYMGYQAAGGELGAGPDPIYYFVPAAAHVVTGSLGRNDARRDEKNYKGPAREMAVGAVQGATIGALEFAAFFGFGYVAGLVKEFF